MPPAMVPDAYPPMPLVTSHSRDSATSKSPQISRPNFIFTVLALASAQLPLFTALLDQFRHQPRPSSLMTRANSGTVVAVKVFVKQHQIFPVRIILEKLHPAGRRPPAIFAAQEDPNQPPRYLSGHMPQVKFAARACRKLHLEVLTVIVMKLLQRLDEQKIHRKPNRAPPIRIAAEHTRARFRRLIIDTAYVPIHRNFIRVIRVKSR